MSQHRPRLIHTLLLILAAAVLAFFFASVSETPHVHGQASGNVQLATAYQPFTFASTGITQYVKITKNIGQTGHLLQYKFSESGAGCVLWFEGSNTNASDNWNVLGVGTDSLIVSQQGSVGQIGTKQLLANGYFPYLRIDINPHGQPVCNGVTVSGSYTASQTPFPTVQNFVGLGYAAVSGGNNYQCPVGPLAACGIGGGNPWTPYLVGGVSCVNTAATVYYLQIQDIAQSPATGTFLLLSLEVPANGQAQYPGPILMGMNQLFIGQFTTPTGNTAAPAGSLQCNVYVNGLGPFGILSDIAV